MRQHLWEWGGCLFLGTVEAPICLRVAGRDEEMVRKEGAKRTRWIIHYPEAGMACPQPEERSGDVGCEWDTRLPHILHTHNQSSTMCADKALCVSRAPKAAFTAQHGDTCANVCMQTRTSKRNRRSFEHCSIFLEWQRGRYVWGEKNGLLKSIQL